MYCIQKPNDLQDFENWNFETSLKLKKVVVKIQKSQHQKWKYNT